MKQLLPAALLIVTSSAFANCGNDKNVGEGCTDAVPTPVVTVTDTNTNTNTNTATNAASARASSRSSAASLAVAENTVTATGGAGGTSTSSVVFTMPRAPVSMAYAPPVQATATCAIPLSAGLSFINVGGSFGTAYVDANCALLEQVRAVAQLGDTEVAFEMLCASKAYADARARQGRPCSK